MANVCSLVSSRLRQLGLVPLLALGLLSTLATGGGGGGSDGGVSNVPPPPPPAPPV